MEYWNDMIVERSWKILLQLKKYKFILIGGWANYLWTKKFKSKDIDIVVDFKLLEILKKDYELRKNDNLRKYEIKKDEVDIDIYVPFYSKLAFPVEEIRSTPIEGFLVARVEDLLILKQGAEIARAESEKGEKDRLDIISILFYCDVDFKDYKERLKKYNISGYFHRLRNIIKTFFEYHYFDMNPRELKLKKKEVMEKLK